VNRPTESYLKVHYELRPAKQVERRMLVDALQILSLSDFQIRDYQYTGMGSIYFIDFILFHRALGVSKMLSVEYSTNVAKRVEFNRPFKCVNLQIAPIGDVIPTLSGSLKHILWLDYDAPLSATHLQDVSLAGTYLTTGSILLVTVDAEPPTESDEPADWRNYFSEQAGEYFDAKLKNGDFAQSKLPARSVELIERALQGGMVGRTNIDFIPLFNFVYQDGHKMLTMGGMIGTQEDRDRIAKSALSRCTYYRDDLKLEPCVITVPRLTRKERQYLDQFMPCEDRWIPDDFELKHDDVLAYRDIYRYCPAYAELFF